MDKILYDLFIKILGIGSSSGIVLIIVCLMFFPEKIEKWSALVWKLLSKIGGVFKFAHKKYVKHDLQGRVNDFVRNLKKETPCITTERLKIEWIEPSATKESFIANGEVVIRLKKEDPQDHNFVHGAYYFVSNALLPKTKRYISQNQREAIDLFICTKLIEDQKPEVIDYYLREYLHLKTEDKKAKINIYLDDYKQIDNANMYFPVFIQELDFLGNKVFGRRKDDLIIREVNEMIYFLKAIANRKVGDDNTDLDYNGNYCKFGIVIVGKSFKIQESIEPYVTFIQKQLVANDTESIYLLSKLENEEKLKEISKRFATLYNVELSNRLKQKIKSKYQSSEIDSYLLIMRKKGIPLIQPSK